MDQFISNITSNLQNINWEGPAAFILGIIAIFALFRKWSLVLLVMLILVVGWGAQDIILMNMDTKDTVISVPLLTYVIGGLAVFILALFSFFKSE